MGVGVDRIFTGAGALALVFGVIIVAGFDVFRGEPVSPQPRVEPIDYQKPVRHKTVTAVPSTGAVTLQYLGDSFNCSLDLIIDVGGQTVIPTTNQVVVNGVALGNVPYTVNGTIGCPNAGVCTAYGNGTLNVHAGATYNLIWQNTTSGQCGITFVPAG